jgi:hypothetical protein
MADGYRVRAEVRIAGQTYSNEAIVTLAQMADQPTRAKIRQYMEYQLILGAVQDLGGITFTAVKELDVAGFQPDATGAIALAGIDPPA